MDKQKGIAKIQKFRMWNRLCEAFKFIKYPTENNDFLFHKTLRDYFIWSGHGMYLNQGELFL